MNKLKCIFLGTPEISVPSVKCLYNNPNIELIYIISMPDRPAGRGHKLKSPEVIQFAKKNSIPYFQTSNINREEEFLTTLENNNIDFFMVFAFAQFLGKRILDMPNIAAFNIHTSLLPKYRGAAPIQYALLNGDTKTGITIQKMVKKMDAGDIAWTTEVAIEEDETAVELYNKLKNLSADILILFLDKLLQNKLVYNPQDETKVSFAPTIKKNDGFIDFQRLTYIEIVNKLKAFSPWPGIYCFLNKKRLKILQIDKTNISLPAGKILINNNELIVGSLSDSIRLQIIQLEGKKKCSDKDLLNGIKDKININPDNIL